MIDIVMTTWKREGMTRLALNALKQNTKIPYRLILIDNGSHHYARELFVSRADIYVKMDENIGLEAAKNFGMQFVGSPYFISTDNDILVQKPVDNKCWLERLHDLYMTTDGVGAIALRPQIMVGTRVEEVFEDESKEFTEFGHVPGYMRIMDTKLVNSLGAWNHKTPLRGHEELWISKRMQNLEFKVGWATHIKCYHLWGDMNWGYGDLPMVEHGHNPVSHIPQDDWDEIYKLTGIKNEAESRLGGNPS